MDLFRAPHYLLMALLATVAAAGLWYWSEKRRLRIASLFVSPEILSKLFDIRAFQARRIQYGLRAAALVLVLGALAGPQWGVELMTSRAKGNLVVIAVDTSLSMLSEDIRPNRMDRAKSALGGLIDGVAGGKVGLIAFEGDAFIQCPLTTDFGAAKSFLRRLQAGMIPRPGTALGKAIRVGTQMLSKFPGHKALVLLTDGEDHKSAPLAAAKAAAEAGVHLFIIGMGSPDGGPIPVKDASGRLEGYKKDKSGKTIVTKLGERTLISLAAASEGAYFRATDSEEEIGEIIRAIERLDQSELSAAAANRYKNRYQFLLIPAFLLLWLATAWPERPRRAAAGVLLAALWLHPGLAGAAISDFKLWGGNQHYEDEEYGQALNRYRKADPKDPITRFNAGAALYKLGDFDASKKMFATAVDPEKTPEGMAPKAFYNLGNSFYREKDFKKAAEAYKRCLLLDPSDKDCRHNLVTALKQSNKKKQQKKDDKKKKQDKKKNKKKKDGEDEKDKKGKPPPGRDRPRPQGMSQENAKRLLQAVAQKERDAQKRYQKNKQQAQMKSKPEVDW